MGVIWAHVGGSCWSHLSRSGDHLGISWAHLEVTWTVLVVTRWSLHPAVDAVLFMFVYVLVFFLFATLAACCKEACGGAYIYT